MSDPAPQREAILTALERLLAWPEIARSPQLGRFLSYIVERTLAGDGQSIKAYSIAVDVFGRAANFDPQADPIVRVQARRLRGLLNTYYSGPGSAEPIQIHLPVGRYVPEFAPPPAPDEAVEVAPAEPVLAPVLAALPAQMPEAPEAPAAAVPLLRLARVRLAQAGLPRLPRTWFALAGIGVLAAAVAFGMAAWGPQPESNAPVGLPRPSITIVEFQTLTNGSAVAPQIAGLAIELVTDLEQFGDIGVHYGGGGGANIAVSGLPSSDYVLTGIVRPEGAVVQYSAILTHSLTNTVVWDHTLAVPAAEAVAPGVLDTVSKSLSLVLGSPRGPLHVHARQVLALDTPLEGPLNLYLCRVLFDLYRETGSASEWQRASACFAELSEADQLTAMALAATASLLAEDPSPTTPPNDTLANRQRLASANLERAIGLNPISGFIWEQMGRLHESQRALDRSRADFSSAVQLNPANADALAAFARLLAFDGDLAGAERLARDSTDGAPNPPPWYQGVPTLLALRDGDFATAMARAELYAQADRELGPILAIMAAHGVGDSAVVNRYLPQVLDVAAFRAKGVLPRLRERIADTVLMDAIRATLIQAGVPPAALIRAF